MKCLVTGGGGFLGRELVERLIARGDEVISASRKRHPTLEALGVRCVVADLNDTSAVSAALPGVDVVFHVAAKTGIWGSRAEFWRNNVEGTDKLLELCRRAGVKRLVHTSSPSVAFDGRDHVRASNDLPYAARFLAHYPASKAEAERRVLAANGQGGLSTVALRPHLIIGARDPHLVPRIVERARAGKLLMVGDGANEVTLCAVENAAYAHILAADALTPTAAHAGRAYFIGQEQPVNLWQWLRDLLARLGIPPPPRRMSERAAYAVGAACELAWTIARRRDDPPMTRFLAQQLARSHSYDMAPARRDFGYGEVVPLERATDAIVGAMRAAGSGVESTARERHHP